MLSTNTNYFIGNNPAKWRTNVPAYAKVLCEGVYRGVNLVFYGNQQELEYDFVVTPGADPGRIALDLRGADDLSINRSGDLVMHIPGGEILLKKPSAYQESNGVEENIPVRYVLKSLHKVGFQVGSYNAQKNLVIDPALTYSTYLGGSAGDQGNAIAVDAAGDAYITGSTFSADFPTTGGAVQGAFAGGDCSSRACTDVFITKLNPTGTAIVYSTYLGGAGEDVGRGLALDASGNAFIVGSTSSSDFPTTPGTFQRVLKGNTNAFVAKLRADGSALLYSTYLGGSAVDSGTSIAVDASESAYITGLTGSADFPTTAGVFQTAFGGATDAFLTKLTPEGSGLVYSGFLGGSGTDVGSGIAIDASGNAYVTGSTNSTDFPRFAAFESSLGGATDAFVTKVRADGSAIVYSTYLGGSGADAGSSITVDTSGNVYLTGSTASNNFPTVHPLQSSLAGSQAAFVSKLKADGSALDYSTYLGGSGSDAGSSIAIDMAGNAYITGQTNSPDFPQANSIKGYSGASDAFIAELDPSGSKLAFSTYLGGGSSDGGESIAVDHSGNIYVTGFTSSDNFPTTPGVFQGSFAGGSTRAFVAEISTADPSGVQLSSTSITFPNQSVGTISPAQNVKLTNTGNSSLNITSLQASGDFSQTNTCGSVVLAAGTCTISITFSPTARGARTGAVTLNDDAPGSPQSIALTGTGIAPAVTLSVNSLTFPDEPLSTTSPAEAVTLTNSGQDTLTITGINTNGDFAETDSCVGSVAAGASCTINVTFRPTLAGTRTGIVAITDNAPGSPHVVQLSGTGVGPNALLSTQSLTFADQPVGTISGSQTVILTNNGNAPMSIAGITITAGFAETNNCSRIQPAGTLCNITVTFTPTVAGITFGTITIADNAPGSPQVISLSGNGLSGAAPVVFLSPSPLAFGLQPVNTTSVALPLLLTNTGNAPLTVTSIAVTGEFSETDNCVTTLAALAQCTINVSFAPTGAGAQSGAVTVTDNAGGSPQSATLAGAGIDFGIAISPPSATINAGKAQTFSIKLTPTAGFNQTIALTCSGAPQAATCSISPGIVGLDGVNSASTTMTVTTGARSMGPPRDYGPRIPLPPPMESIRALWLLALMATTIMAGTLLLGVKHKRALILASIMEAILLAAACNVGSQKITGTPPGNYSLTVTATVTPNSGTGTLTQTVGTVLVVN